MKLSTLLTSGIGNGKIVRTRSDCYAVMLSRESSPCAAYVHPHTLRLCATVMLLSIFPVLKLPVWTKPRTTPLSHQPRIFIHSFIHMSAFLRQVATPSN